VNTVRKPRIDYYDFGVIVIDGKEYRSDVIITPKKVISDWWRLEGHRLQIPDVRDYLLEDVDEVVIGTGYDGMMSVDNDVVEAFKRRGKNVHILRTRDAVKLYNELIDKGKKVMAFLHLTC